MHSPAMPSRGGGCSPACSYSFITEASLPSASWRGKVCVGLISHLLDWEWGHFRGLACLNSASRPVSTRSAQDWPSPALPVSIRAGVLEWGASGTGASTTGDSSAGVSWVGAAVAPALGSLEPTPGPSACRYDSSRDSLGFGWGRGNGAPIKWGHSSLDQLPYLIHRVNSRSSCNQRPVAL